MDSDPLFVDPDGVDGLVGTWDDDLRLSSDSPCINAGDSSFDPTNIAYDLDGEELWRRNVQKEYGDFAFLWTFSASPTIWEGVLYLPVLQRDDEIITVKLAVAVPVTLRPA